MWGRGGGGGEEIRRGRGGGEGGGGGGGVGGCPATAGPGGVGGVVPAPGVGGKRDRRGEERKAEPLPAGGWSVGLKTVFNRRRYSSFSLFVG